MAHAKLRQARLVLTYVIEWTPYSFHTAEELAERHKRRESEIERANSQILEPEVAAISAQGLEVEAVVHHGKIAATLVELASSHNAGQIYIGRRGESLVHSMIFGSVTASLIQTATVPVTVVP